MKHIADSFIRGIFCLLTLILLCWAIPAIYYSNLPWPWLRTTLAILFPVFSIGVLWGVRPFRRAAQIFMAAFAVVLAGWLWIPARNNRHWQADVAVMPSATIDGELLTVHNIRNCDYRTSTDYTVSYYDKTFDLSKLQGADLFIIYWGSPLIAHTIMSFCFGDDQYLCISIETRKEIGEGYSAVKGFFKQFELFYVIGDERDLIRLRTNFRKETVYLYRLTARPELVREVLLDYLKSVNQLNQKPEWYNALTQNCTTAVRGHAAPYTHGKMSWKILANGYLDTLLYERRAIDTSMPFEQMKAASCINEKALVAGDSPDFSMRIREGLPNPHAQDN